MRKLFTFIILCCIFAFSDASAQITHQPIHFTGTWNCLDSSGISARGVIPGSLHNDLLRAGIISDPFVGANEHDIQWVGDKLQQMGFQKDRIVVIDAKERFFSKLEGVSDPEKKRKIIGYQFIAEFENYAKDHPKLTHLAQGTLYPDVIESAGHGSGAKVIKSHHNVGGLPDKLALHLTEPLRYLFKDEVREVGREIGLPSHVVDRQPFPGPGLAIRIIGDITEEKLAILREADWIYREEIRKAGLQKDIWQYFAVLTGIKTVGVMGDERTYSYTIGLRGVTSIDGMTADWARIPYPVLEIISTRIVNEVKNVNRIVYDITSKPPSTIEWE